MDVEGVDDNDDVMLCVVVLVDVAVVPELNSWLVVNTVVGVVKRTV